MCCGCRHDQAWLVRSSSQRAIGMVLALLQDALAVLLEAGHALVTGKGQGDHPARVPLQHVATAVAKELPDAHCQVVGRRGSQHAVSRDGNVPHGTDRLQTRTVDCIPADVSAAAKSKTLNN